MPLVSQFTRPAAMLVDSIADHFKINLSNGRRFSCVTLGSHPAGWDAPAWFAASCHRHLLANWHWWRLQLCKQRGFVVHGCVGGSCACSQAVASPVMATTTTTFEVVHGFNSHSHLLQRMPDNSPLASLLAWTRVCSLCVVEQFWTLQGMHSLSH